MKELRSKRKPDNIQVMSDEEFDQMVSEGIVPVKNFIVTDIKVRKIIPPLTDIPAEVKIKNKKNEG